MLFFDGLVGDIKMGADLVLKGKLSFVPERIRGLEAVKTLYKEAAGPAPGTEHGDHPGVER